MKVLLAYKWGRDEEDAMVYEDGSVKWRRDKLVPSDDEAAAIAYAREVASATGGELVAATMGTGDVSWALARGAASAVSAEGLMPESDEGQTASHLAALVEAAGGAELVVVGDAQKSAGVAGAVASKLGLPLVSGVRDFAVHGDAGKLVAHRATPMGVEELEIELPAVVSVAAVDTEKNVPSMKEMLAARKAPVSKIDLADDAAARVSVAAFRAPAPHLAKLFEGEPAQAAERLVATLRADGVL
ncbi:electron transfer flavoprotein subunit beta/FixA family protein [Eggerthella guodeyinii]|uniref:Electron transfer flavoprotein subunit alpha n=1 Tax=Eggerthella guodeyinii TaxID=2690837 RepID=A0A6N7RJK5_9ACTN|nr:electron transfer flavoprotein subunit alpha [Eggerthella guodeyinii]MRX81107.1 electron transfer flavoprotein subunit alpha [Eggerthella guodeyinii]